MIEITEKQIERVTLLLHGIKGAKYKAFYNALNRAATTINKEAAGEVQKTYIIKQKNFKDAHKSKVSVRGDSKWSSGITAIVRFAGYAIELMKFDVTPKRPGTKKTVQARTLKSATKARLENAYIADFGRGIGVFERKHPWRNSSVQIYGPSAAHMIDNDKVREKILDKGMETLDKRLEHEISRILNGYGGK